jgi:hypothetical protein
MIPHPKTHPVAAALAAAFLLGQSILLAQQPAGRGGGRGGAAPALTPAQSTAIGQMEVPAALAQEQAAAATALTQAALAQPRNDAAITAAANRLAAAEAALAIARADGFARVQSGLRPLTVEQAVAAFGRGGGAQQAPPVPDDYAGFTSIFDGKTLAGWDGDPMFWRVDNGVIVAESSPEKVVGQQYPGNSFLIWRNGTLRDFELKIESRFTAAAGNSGIQVRARMANPETRPWGIAGYQIDMLNAGGDGSVIWFGEGGGGRMSGHAVTRRLPNGQKLIASLGNDVNAAIKPPGEWNSYHIIMKGNVGLVHVNGRLASVLIDENQNPSLGYALEGLLALQMHTGAPFRLEFRNVYYKDINTTPPPIPVAPAAAPTAPAGGRGRGGQ